MWPPPSRRAFTPGRQSLDLDELTNISEFSLPVSKMRMKPAHQSVGVGRNGLTWCLACGMFSGNDRWNHEGTQSSGMKLKRR